MIVFHNNRIIMLAVYASAQMGGGFLLTSFNAISKTVVRVFDSNVIEVNLCNLMFYFLFVPANFIVVKSVDKFGLKVCVIHL